MNNLQRLKLKEMISNNNVEDHTNEIRKLKHSDLIKDDITKMIKLKEEGKLSEAGSKCNFLFNNYTLIYNKLLNNNLDINIMYRFLDILKNIEDGKLDQHEGSYLVGEFLKKIFIDTKIDTDTPSYRKSKISWKEYKDN